MDGDNDLEVYVPHDIEELEAVGSTDAVAVLAQIDRIDGYTTGDGDWTGTRRYRMARHPEPGTGSELLADLGELDMGDPQTLSDFLLWGAQTAPADRYLVVLWDHGDTWSAAAQPPPSIASDDTSGSVISIADGELAAALQPFVQEHGPIDLISFDACSMASWEVAHMLSPYAEVLNAAETTVGAEGLDYAAFLTQLNADPGMEALALSVEMGQQAVDLGEWTWVTLDLAQLPAVSAAVDALAAELLAQPALLGAAAAARDAAESTDRVWHYWYLDLPSYLAQLDALGLGSPAAVQAALDATVVDYAHQEFVLGLGGMTIFTDLHPAALEDYRGAGATWSQDTRWDELLEAMGAAE